MKTAILKTSTTIFFVHKKVIYLTPLIIRKSFCEKVHHTNEEPNQKFYSKNPHLNTQPNYKVNKIKYPANYDKIISESNELNEQKNEVKRISFDGLDDADTFGTFSKDFQTQNILYAMSDEEDDVLEKNFINDVEGKTRISINQYAFIIKEFIKQKKIGNAIDVLQTRMLRDDKVKPESYIYNLLIGACGQVGFTKKAFNLYNDMKKRALKVTPHTYTSLFNACANSPWPDDGLQRATDLRKLMVKKNYEPNQTNYHAMIKAFGRCGDLETAFLLVDEMVDKNILINTTTFNFLLQSCITDKKVGFRHALLVWRKMLQKQVKPSLHSYNLLLRCARQSGLGDLDTTKKVIGKIIKSSKTKQKIKLDENTESNELALQPVKSIPNLLTTTPHLGNIISLQDIIQPEHRLMLIGGSSGILHMMRTQNVWPDIKTFSQLLELIPPTQCDEEELLKEIANHGIPMDIDFFNMLIKKRCLRHDYEKAKEVLKLIQIADLQPDITTFGVLALTCTNFKEAGSLIADINEIGFRVNIEIMGTFLNNAYYCKNISYAKKVMQIVKKENLTPNAQFMQCLKKFFYQVKESLDSKNNTPAYSTIGTNLNQQEQKRAEALEFCSYYKLWCKEVEPEELPHPWKQFNKHTTKQDEEFLKTGRLKIKSSP